MFRSIHILFLGLLIVLLTNCTGPDTHLTLTPIDYEQLPSFHRDRMVEALPALKTSCEAIIKNPNKKYYSAFGYRTMEDFTPLCHCLLNRPIQHEQELRQLITKHLTPYKVTVNGSNDGIFTGYYEPILNGSLTRHGKYQTPLYKKPNSRTLATLPRKDIVRGALKGRNLELVYVDDPIAAFFIQVQGSGRVRLQNGKMLHLGYSSGNKQPYTPIGRTLLDQGYLVKDRDPITMQSISQWLKNNPSKAEEIMSSNESYVFFMIRKGGMGPIGSQNVPITAGRSMAIDPKFVALGTPLWLDMCDKNLGSFQRLMVAQDTGGAIKGGIRGDYFFGTGHNAGEKAGVLNANGTFFLLLPKIQSLQS
ncbi:MAG TPA: murein transglycosylase [Holosporales bacterium]|nr:murein transglycosylase [Holosporales bacterium]